MTVAETFTKVAKVSDVPQGTAKVFVVDGVEIALCNADGKIYAVADICTHDNGPLGEGELVGCEIECPRHGARFDLTTGQALCLPAIVPIATYKVEVKGEDVFVDVSKPK